MVSAGANQTIFLPTNTANLVGSVTNNWLRCTLTSQWSQVSGPGTVTFGNASQPATTATFPNSAGDYVLQLTANNGFGSSSNQVTIIVAVPAVAISLSPPSAGPDVVGATQTMTAVVTSGAAAVPVIGVTVQFGVTGANPQTVPETTDPTGTATFPLQGANSGTDTVQASYGGATSNTATVSWLVPSPNVSTSTILGRFFPNPNNTGTFDVLPTATPVFSQYFPTILFNPPTGTVNNLACSIVNTNARPFTDVTTDATANFKGSVIAQGNGVQAGVG